MTHTKGTIEIFDLLDLDLGSVLDWTSRARRSKTNTKPSVPTIKYINSSIEIWHWH